MFSKLSYALYGLPFASRFYARVKKGLPVGASVNVSERCPIDCDCYWRKRVVVDLGLQGKQLPIMAGKALEMSDEEMIAFFHNLADQGTLLVNMIGGEPYVRAGLLPKLAGILPWSWITTSGTTPLLNLERTTHFVSIDGKDAETHDYIRRSKGLFNRIIKNVSEARRKYSPFPLFIHSVLNAKNYQQIGDILDFWKSNGLADGVVFSTWTAVGDCTDDAEFLLTDSQQKAIVDDLLKFRKIYGSFLGMSKVMIQKLSPEHMSKQTPNTCATAKYVNSYKGNGEKITQCIFGDKADCSRCGCVITTQLGSLVSFPPDLETATLISKTILLNN